MKTREPTKYFAYSLILVGISCSISTASLAASNANVADLTCAEFMSMDVEDQQAALNALRSPEAASAKPSKSQALVETDADSEAPDEGYESSDSDTTDSNEVVVDTELKAVLAACQGYEAAFVADRMTP